MKNNLGSRFGKNNCSVNRVCADCVFCCKQSSEVWVIFCPVRRVKDVKRRR